MSERERRRSMGGRGGGEDVSWGGRINAESVYLMHHNPMHMHLSTVLRP